MSVRHGELLSPRSRTGARTVARLTAMAGPVALIGFTARLAVALARRPRLVPTALRQAATMAPTRWWARRPHLPVPPSDYLEFRTVTATGDASGPPDVHDTIVWLEWCRSMRALPA